jgi:hypothetical protein
MEGLRIRVLSCAGKDLIPRVMRYHGTPKIAAKMAMPATTCFFSPLYRTWSILARNPAPPEPVVSPPITAAAAAAAAVYMQWEVGACDCEMGYDYELCFRVFFFPFSHFNLPVFWLSGTPATFT